MKKLIVAFGVVVAAVAGNQASASAHSYSGYQNVGQGSQYGAWQNDESDNSSSNASDWKANRCQKLGYRLDRLNGNFDQTNDNRVTKTQSVIDKLNDKDCAVTGNIVETLVDNGNFTTLVAAVKTAGLVDALSAPGDKTVFAPTNQAFAALPAGTVEALLADVPTLTKVLTYHVVDGAVDSQAAVGLDEATTLNGQNVKIDVRDDGVYINDSKLVLTDIHTSNGIVHVIDAVLMPQL